MNTLLKLLSEISLPLARLIRDYREHRNRCGSRYFF